MLYLFRSRHAPTRMGLLYTSHCPSLAFQHLATTRSLLFPLTTLLLVYSSIKNICYKPLSNSRHNDSICNTLFKMLQDLYDQSQKIMIKGFP